VLPWLVAAVSAPAAVALARLTGTRPLFTPYAMATLRFNRWISHERARRDLGYAPRPLDQSVRDTVLWFRERGWLAR
jgi:dihydroflavonol-4-reductase